MRDRPQWENAPEPKPLAERQAEYQAMLNAMSPVERAAYEKSEKEAYGYMHKLWLKDCKEVGITFAYLILTIIGTIKIFMSGYILGGFVFLLALLTGFVFLLKKIYPS